MSNRRDFLKNISLFTAGGLLAGKAGSVNAANAALGVGGRTGGLAGCGFRINQCL